MNAIKPYTQIFDDLEGQNILKKIEACGRVCYKSEKRIEEGSAEKFISNLVKRGHEAVLEHGSFIFELNSYTISHLRKLIEVMGYENGYISFLRITNSERPVVSGNVRAWREFLKQSLAVFGMLPFYMKRFVIENPILFPEFQEVSFGDWENYFKGSVKFEPIKATDLKTETERLVHWDVTVKFVVDRGISHELVRHRVASFCQESTRYCNYSKDDFGKEITFIIPPYLAYKSEGWNAWKDCMKQCEDTYFKMLDIGLTAQEARAVLPNSLKTEVVMTANLNEWKHFFILRTANAAHPQMVEVSRPLLKNFKTLFPSLFENITY